MIFIIADILMVLNICINDTNAFIPNNPYNLILDLLVIAQLAWFGFMIYMSTPEKQQEFDEECKKEMDRIYETAYRLYDRGMKDPRHFNDFLRYALDNQCETVYKDRTKYHIIRAMQEAWHIENPGYTRTYY